MKYLLNVDWLEFLGSTDIHLNNFFTNGIYKFSNGVNLQKIPNYHSRAFPICFQIFNQNGNIGKLFTKTMDLSMSDGFNIDVKIDNFKLYQPNLQDILQMIVDALEIDQMKIKRLDICYDTDNDVLSRFKSLYYDPDIKFRYKNKIKVNGTGQTDEELSVGSFKSRKRTIAIYCKTKEIKSSGKNYITNIHRNYFGYKSIYRVELRIMRNTLEIKDIDILNLGNSEYLEKIFHTYFDNLIQFKDVNTNEIIEFITLDETGGKLDRIKISKSGGESPNKIKGVVNFLDKEIKTKQFRGNIKNWNEIRKIILKKFELEQWYSVKKYGGRF